MGKGDYLWMVEFGEDLPFLYILFSIICFEIS